MVTQVLLAPATPDFNQRDLQRVAQGARAAQQGDITFNGYWKVVPSLVVADFDFGAQSFIAANATAGQVDGQLPAAADSQGLVYVVKKADSSGNAVNIVPAGSDTIDGSASTLSMTTAWQVTRLFCDGSQWLTW